MYQMIFSQNLIFRIYFRVISIFELEPESETVDWEGTCLSTLHLHWTKKLQIELRKVWWFGDLGLIHTYTVCGQYSVLTTYGT